MTPRLLARFAPLAPPPWILPGRWRLLLLLAPPVLAAAVLAAVALFPAPGAAPPSGARPGAPPAAAGADSAQSDGAVTAPAGLLVEVSGAVARPGLYRVARGERVSAAIAAAGGLAPDADPDRMPNLAARLKGGQQVAVPPLRRPGRSAARTSARTTPAGSLHQATPEQLVAIPGVNPHLAT